jgi:hypothetical protein
MGRRLKQQELMHLLAQAQQRLWEQRAAYPLPSVELDREQYLQQIAARGLLFGRWHGASTAYQTILQQRRWGPVSQARAHDALVEAANRIWIEREAKITEHRSDQLSAAYTEAMTERDANARLTGRSAFWTTLTRREREIEAFTTDS